MAMKIVEESELKEF